MLPTPDLARAEDYVRTADNNFTAIVGEEPSAFEKKALQRM